MTLSKLLFELSGEIQARDTPCTRNCAPDIHEDCRPDEQHIIFTSSEASRQIERLSGMNLIEKLSDDSYAITSLGRLMLSFLPGIDFVYKNSDYFRTHDTTPIPRELVM